MLYTLVEMTEQFTRMTSHFMFYLYVVMFICCLGLSSSKEPKTDATADDVSGPKTKRLDAPLIEVMIAVLVTNKAHTLPWFLGHLERLDYPKENIAIWFRLFNNADNSTSIVQEWTDALKSKYKKIKIVTKNVQSAKYQLPLLREEALTEARNIKAQYLFMLDPVVFLTNPQTLRALKMERKIIVGPKLDSVLDDVYTNFWAGKTDTWTYKRTPDYLPILRRDKIGCFPVPMLHSAFLLNLGYDKSKLLTYFPADYSGREWDFSRFAASVEQAGLTFHVVNKRRFGQILVIWEETTLEEEKHQFTFAKVEANVKSSPFNHSEFVSTEKVKPRDVHISVDKIFVLGLKKRSDRRQWMKESMKAMGLKFTFFDAVDGSKFEDPKANKTGLHYMPELDRLMTCGEVACFLTHYFVWQEIVEKGYKTALILEDDVKFGINFNARAVATLAEADRLVPGWHLLYAYRNLVSQKAEKSVKHSTMLKWAGYSHAALGYFLTVDGAKKLLEQKPLEKLIPADHYLPMMFDEHSNDDWKVYYGPRDLIALAAEPNLLTETHLFKDPDHVSDTSTDCVVRLEKFKGKYKMYDVKTCKSKHCSKEEL